MKSVLVVSSDAGGTFALVPVIRELLKRNVNVRIFASGPAVKIWQEEGIISNFTSVEDNISENDAIHLIDSHYPDIVVCGAGAYNVIEHTFRRAAAQMGIFCFALVDGWFNFKARFRREHNGSIIYSIPDLIGVMNEASRSEMIQDGFDANAIVIVGAPHIEETVRFIKSISEADVHNIFERYDIDKGVITLIFFSAPVVNDDKQIAAGVPSLGYTEDSILHESVQVLKDYCMRNNTSAQFIVKPHPSESYENLVKIMQNEGRCQLLDCRVIEKGTTKELMCIADAVLGMTTTALIEAAYSGKPALSVQIGRNLTFHPDTYFANIPGIIPIYDTDNFRLALDNLFSTPKSSINNSNDRNYNQAAQKVADILSVNFGKNKRLGFSSKIKK